MVEKLIELEKIYSKNNYYGEKINGQTIKIKKGTIPILLTAPHSVRQIRNNKTKAQDMYTGSIVDYIQEQTNCFSITNIFTDNNDPNIDNINCCIYKQELTNLCKENNIKLILDFHGMDIKRESAIDICTNHNKTLLGQTNILNCFITELEKNITIENKPITKNKYFFADKKYCITNYSSRELNIPSIELEINKIIRDFYNFPMNAEIFITTMVTIIMNYPNFLMSK